MKKSKVKTPAPSPAKASDCARKDFTRLIGWSLFMPVVLKYDGLLSARLERYARVDYMHRIWMRPDEKWYASREQSGTAILTGGCHAIDALRWFARSEAEQVCAYQAKTENPIGYPGTISVNIKFEDGKIGRSTTTFDAQMPYRFNIGVYGTEGSIRNGELFAPKLFPGQNNFVKIPCILPDSADVAHHPFAGEVSHFLDCIINDKRPYPDLEDAAQTHEVCFAADLSAESGRPVAISELDNM